jgi:hypothetical protein
MAELKAEVLIDRPVAVVMSFLGELTNHPGFMPRGFSEFGFPGRTAGKGAVMRVRWDHGKAAEDLLLEVVRADENNLVLKSTVASARPLGVWYWVQGGDQGSYVKLVVERQGGGSGGLFRRGSSVLDVWKQVLPKLRDQLQPGEAQDSETEGRQSGWPESDDGAGSLKG